MKYRVKIDVSFSDESDAIKLLSEIEKLKDKSTKPNGTGVFRIIQEASYHTCYHDEEPPSPCENWVYIDFEEEKIK